MQLYRNSKISKSRFLIGVCGGACLIFSLFFFVSPAFAAPPSSPYLPGQTLDPGCAPTSTNCSVLPSLFSTTTLSQGSIPFIGDASGTVYGNATSFFWDNVNDRLGIGTDTPSSALDVEGSATVSGNVTTTGLTVLGVANAGVQCLQVNNNGVISGAGGGCGTNSLGGSGSTDEITFWNGTTTLGGSGNFIWLNASSTLQINGAISSTQLTTTNATTTGLAILNVTSSLLKTNANGAVVAAVPGVDYLATSTGLTVTNFATSSISQFTNDAGYTTTTIQSVLNALSTTAPGLTYTTSTGILSLSSGYIIPTTASATQWNASYASTSLLGSAAFQSSSTFYLASNPNAYIASVSTTGSLSGNGTTGSPLVFTNPGYASSSVTISAGGILSGGGALSANQTISLSTSTLNTAVAALGFVTTTGSNAYDVTSANAFISVATTTNSAALTFSSSSLDLGSAAYLSSSTFYLASNPNGYISTSTGLTVTNFATSSISQFTNDAGYTTTTIQNILNALSTTAPGLTYTTSTGILSLSSGYIIPTTASATQWNASYASTSLLGSAAFQSSSTFYLASNPNAYIATSTLNADVAALGFVTTTGLTSYNVNSANAFISVATTTNSATLTFSSSSLDLGQYLTTSTAAATYYLTSNPSAFISLGGLSAAGTGLSYNNGTGVFTWTNPGYITTSTFNATGTAFYFPSWNAAGNSLTATSSLFESSSTGYIGIGTTNPVGVASIGSAPPQSTTSSLLALGANPLSGGNASGTYLGINSTSSADFLDFQDNSSTALEVTNSSTPNVELYIGPNALASANASGTGIAENQSAGFNGDFINFEVNSSTEFKVASSGMVMAGGFYGQCLISGSFASSTSSPASCNDDVAESYPTFEATTPGDVVAIPASSTQYFDSSSLSVEVGKSRGVAGERVLGVVSTDPGLVFNNARTFLAGANNQFVTATSTVVALTGRVPVKVSLENGPIMAGDELAASADIPGVAVRATSPGYVIGIALQDYSSSTPSSSLVSSASSSAPEILVFVNPTWSLGDLASDNDIASSNWASTNTLAQSSSASGVLDQFTLYIKYALQKLGIAISNGITTIDQLVANRVTTNELCVGSTCVDQSQLQQLLENGTSGGSGSPSNSDVDTTATSTSSDVTTAAANIQTGDALGISFSAPASGDVVSGTVMLDVNITLASSTVVSSVEYQLDGTNIEQGLLSNNPEYSSTWDSTGISAAADGSHTLTAIVTDSTGATSTTSVAITVANASSTQATSVSTSTPSSTTPIVPSTDLSIETSSINIASSTPTSL